MFRMIYATFRRMRRRPLGLLLGMRQPHITTCMKKRCLNTIAVEEGQLPGCRLRSRMAHSWITIAVEDGPLPWISITDKDGPFPWIPITDEDDPFPWISIADEDGPFPWIWIAVEDGPFPWISIAAEDGNSPLIAALPPLTGICTGSVRSILG